MANCSACSAEVVPGTRWCNICHTNIVDPALGKLAPPGKRLGALLLDVVIPIFALFSVSAVGELAGASGTDVGAAIGGLVGLALLVGYIVWAIRLFSRGTTPGKRVLGMRVIKENGAPAGFFTMLVREWFAKWVSVPIFFLGFLWILLDKENQGWHDKLMSTYVTG